MENFGRFSVTKGLFPLDTRLIDVIPEMVDGTGPGNLEQRAQRHLGWILILAVCVRLIYLGEMGATSVLFYQPLLDEQELTNTARELISHHSFGAEPFFKAPLYPVVLALTML